MYCSSIACCLGDTTLAKDVTKVPNSPLIPCLTCILGDTTWAKVVAKVTKDPSVISLSGPGYKRSFSNQCNLYYRATTWVKDVVKIPNNPIIPSLTCILGATTWAKVVA
jgi:hypothetical protein